MKQTRRTFLQTGALPTAGLPLANLKLLGDESAPKAAEPRKQQTKIETFPLVQGGLKPTHHERLNAMVNAQPAVATLRFYRPARVDRVEIPPTVYGRGSPPVPTHPAHMVVSVF